MKECDNIASVTSYLQRRQSIRLILTQPLYWSKKSVPVQCINVGRLAPPVLSCAGTQAQAHRGVMSPDLVRACFPGPIQVWERQSEWEEGLMVARRAHHLARSLQLKLYRRLTRRSLVALSNHDRRIYVEDECYSGSSWR